ncbi:hypothetical protein K8R32_04050 [bacterium]|nr:hypothetical protein [bacterium]
MAAIKKTIKISVEDSEKEKPVKKPATKRKVVKRKAVKKLIKVKKPALKRVAARKTTVKRTVPKKPIVKKVAVIDEDKVLEEKKGKEIKVPLIVEEKVDQFGQFKQSEKIKLKEEINKTEEKPETEEIKTMENRSINGAFSNDTADSVKEVIASSLKEEEDKEIDNIVNQKISSPRSIKVYRKIAYFFIILTVVLIATVAYFMLVKVTIVLIPNQERINNSMIFDIYDAEKGGEKINGVVGVVKLVKIEDEGVYSATGEEVIGRDASGMATIINNYTKNQPLVATTRLITPDGVLFRLRNTVNVSAGGTEEVEIYADDPSADLKISPTKFTIPGLWAGLQDEIFAETKEVIEYKQKVKHHIKEEDIENGIRDLKQKLLTKTKDEINEMYKEYGQIIYKIDENSIVSEVKGEVGDEVEGFTADMKADVVVVAFEGKEAADLARKKFISSLSDNKELISFDEANIIYSLNNYDHVEGVATINSTFEGKVSLRADSEIVEIDKIIGLSNEQLNTYLTSLTEIAGFEVKYYPSFIKWVPRLVDRIKIEIKK